MTNTQSHAKRELDILLKTMPDAIIRDFIPEILALCEAFGKSGQSGGSAPYVASALSQAIKKLLLFGTICPLQGTDDEWMEVGDDQYQNKRKGDVFKHGKDGRAYYLDAIVWQGEDDYDTFTGSVNGVSSRQYVKSFPFEPKTFYVNVVRDFNVDGLEEKEIIETGLGRYVYKLKDPAQLDEVFEYYDRFEFEK